MFDLMSTEASQPLDDITVNTGSPENVRPGESGWTPAVPTDDTLTSPELTINLPPMDDGSYPNVAQITVDDLNGKTGSVTVRVTDSDGEEQILVDNEPLPEGGVIDVTPAISATTITVTLESPSEDVQEENYAITVDVKACEEYPGKLRMVTRYHAIQRFYN